MNISFIVSARCRLDIGADINVVDNILKFQMRIRRECYRRFSNRRAFSTSHISYIYSQALRRILIRFFSSVRTNLKGCSMDFLGSPSRLHPDKSGLFRDRVGRRHLKKIVLLKNYFSEDIIEARSCRYPGPALVAALMRRAS